MSKTAKIAMAIGITIVFLLVTLSIIIKVVITPEKIRENLLPFAERALQRKIDVGNIDIGIFTGVSLVDLRVQNRSTADDFVTVKALSLQYKLLPLLTGNLVIDQILLDQPRIEVVRNEDGTFNFSDLLGGAGSSGQASQDSQSSSGPAVFDLLVNEISIQGGELFFVDRSQNANTPYRYTFEQFNFMATEITLDKAFPMELSTLLNGSRIKLSGQYDVGSTTGDLDLELLGFDLVKFAPYYRHMLPGKLGSAELTANLEVQINADNVASRGKVLLDKLDLALNDFPDATLQKVRLGVDYSMQFATKTKQLVLSTLSVNFNDAVVGAEGEIALAGKEPDLALALILNQLDLRTLFEAVPKGLTRDFQKYSLAGKLDGRIELSGPPSHGAKLLKRADLQLSEVTASIDKMRAGVSGQVNFANQKAESRNLVLNIAEQKMDIQFSADDLLSDLIKGEFLISAKQLDLNRILPTETGGAEPTKAVQRQPSLADEIGPFDLPLAMKGQLRVGKLLYKQLELGNVQADMLLEDNHLKINNLRSGIAGGELSAVTDINLGVKGLQYSGQMKLDQSNMLDLVAGVLPGLKQNVSGVLQWQNNFSGRGTVPDNLLRSLQLKGLLQLQRGQISGSPLLEQLAVFLGVPDLKILSFEALQSQYDLRNGLASLSGQLDSSKAKLKPQGTVGVDGALDLKLDARLSPDLMQRIGVKTGLKNTLSDKDGWGVLPLVIKGSVTSPKIAFDAEALQRQAASKAKEEVTKRLLDKVAPGGGQEQEPVKQLLEGTLNRLFGN
jgi:AsmA protein